MDGAIRCSSSTPSCPDSWNAYDSLAEAWYAKATSKKRWNSTEKSLELNPANENGKKFVATIEKELKK